MVSESGSSPLNDIQLGCRVECAEQYGTVRFIGPIEGFTSYWLGIEWDDPSRGKHDGSVAGVRYFQTSHPTAGSFVRPKKVQLGKSAIIAITSRYGTSESNMTMNQLQLINFQKEINAPFIEMVGFDKIREKQSNFHDLKIVSLRLQKVNGPGEQGELGELCPNLIELDLSKNLLYKWSDIFDICEQLTELQWLNLSENLLTFPDSIENIVLPSINVLICGFMKLDWSDILKLSQIFPNIEELRVPYNNITDIDIPHKTFLSKLKVIDLEGNYLQSWDKVNKLGYLTNLEQLYVGNININKIQLPPCEPEKKLSIFRHLKQLVISDNCINDWESISELNKLKVLEDLKCVKNPILDTETPATCVQLIIARIGTLKVLNGTIIKPDERNGAEYDYLKKYALEYFNTENDQNLKKQFLEKHPRYLQLIKKHGAVEKAEVVQESQLIKSGLTTLNIKYENVTVKKKVPKTMQLQKLIILIQKIFKLPSRPALYYVSNTHPEIEMQLDDEFKQLGYYTIEDDDIIIARTV